MLVAFGRSLSENAPTITGQILKTTSLVFVVRRSFGTFTLMLASNAACASNSNLQMGSSATLEDGSHDEVEGYDRLAKMMADVPDAAIFRRFAHLSAESLLHQQAELEDLEKVVGIVVDFAASAP